MEDSTRPVAVVSHLLALQASWRYVISQWCWHRSSWMLLLLALF